METYVILRRGGWRTPDELQQAAARSTAEGERMPDDIRWIRSYVLAEARRQPRHGLHLPGLEPGGDPLARLPRRPARRRDRRRRRHRRRAGRPRPRWPPTPSPPETRGDRMTRKHLLVLVVAALGLLVAASPSPTRTHSPTARSGARDRKATRSIALAVAEAAGYGLLKDAAGIACIDNPGVGGMGIHYVNGDLVGDGEVDRAQARRARLRARPDGSCASSPPSTSSSRTAWDAKHRTPPRLFGQEFELQPAHATGTACRRSTSCTPGSGSTTRAACSTTGTRA